MTSIISAQSQPCDLRNLIARIINRMVEGKSTVHSVRACAQEIRR